MQPADGAAPARSTRARPTLLLALAGAFLVARVALALYDARHPAPRGGLVTWTALERAKEVAASTNRPILYDFSAGWCEPCKQMERDLFADGAAAAFISASFVAVRVDDDDQGISALALRREHAVAALPTLLVTRSQDKKPVRSEGYRGKRATLAFLRSALAPRD